MVAGELFQALSAWQHLGNAIVLVATYEVCAAATALACKWLAAQPSYKSACTLQPRLYVGYLRRNCGSNCNYGAQGM